VSLSTIFSSSNIFFFLESGYFDESKSIKPLLHTWSLSIEEQFYLVWPLLIILLAGLVRNAKIFSLVFLGLMSLLWSEVYLSKVPDAAFYFMPLRAYEFVLGALLVFLRSDKTTLWGQPLFGFGGLALILISITTFDSETRFPGLSSLLPAVGAALIIRFGNHGVITLILGNRLMVAIGKVSYSMYLVHWPIIVFAKYWKFGGLGFRSLMVLVPIIAISALSCYFLVEKRFRYKRDHDKSVLLNLSFRTGAITVVSLLIALCVSIISSKGWQWRYPDSAEAALFAVSEISNDNKNKLALIERYQNEFTALANLNNQRFIIGDSFAQDTYVAIKSAMGDLPLGYIRIKAACQPLIPADYSSILDFNTEEACQEVRERVFHDDRLANAKTIFLAASWREPALSRLGETLTFLKHKTSAKIVLFGPRPSFVDVPTKIIREAEQWSSENPPHLVPQSDITSTNDKFRRYAENYDIEYIDLLERACDTPDRCPIVSPLDAKTIYSDHAHWSISGAKWMGSQLVKLDTSNW